MSKFKLYIHYGRLLSLHQSSYPLVLLFLRQKKKKKMNVMNLTHKQKQKKPK